MTRMYLLFPHGQIQVKHFGKDMHSTDDVCSTKFDPLVNVVTTRSLYLICLWLASFLWKWDPVRPSEYLFLNKLSSSGFIF